MEDLPTWAWWLLFIGLGLFAWVVTEIVKKGRGR